MIAPRDPTNFSTCRWMEVDSARCPHTTICCRTNRPTAHRPLCITDEVRNPFYLFARFTTSLFLALRTTTNCTIRRGPFSSAAAAAAAVATKPMRRGDNVKGVRFVQDEYGAAKWRAHSEKGQTAYIINYCVYVPPEHLHERIGRVQVGNTGWDTFQGTFQALCICTFCKRLRTFANRNFIIFCQFFNESFLCETAHTLIINREISTWRVGWRPRTLEWDCGCRDWQPVRSCVNVRGTIKWACPQ